MTKKLLNKLLSLTPFEVRRRRLYGNLPAASFDAIELALAFYLEAQRTPTFVQIGACDGTSGDSVYHFVCRGEMRSVVVEPIPESAEKLRKAYQGVGNLSIVEAAIAGHDGQVALFKVRDDVVKSHTHPEWALQVSAMDPKHLVKHLFSESQIEEVQVACMTLGTLMAEHGLASIDVLQIDTEGFDAEIVRMALQLPVLPECISFEFIHLQPDVLTELFESLQKHGYRWIHDHWNTLAVHERVFEHWKHPSR